MSVYCWLCNTTVPDADAAEHAALLELQGNEIAGEGHMGWGNTMHDAAEILTADATRIASLESQISALRADAQIDYAQLVSDSYMEALKEGGMQPEIRAKVYMRAMYIYGTKTDAIAIPSAASIGEGGLGDAGREMK